MKPKKTKLTRLIEKLKPESFGEFASMCFKPGGKNGARKPQA